MRSGLSIRRLELDDGPELFELIEQNRVHLSPWMPWLPHVQSLEDVQRFISDSQKLDRDHLVAHECGLFLEDEMVGAMGVNSIDWAFQSANIGYWISQQWAGQGLTTEGVGLLCAFGFDTLDLHRLEMRVDVDNTASLRVAEKAGFQREGLLREALSIGGRRKNLVLLSRLQD